MMDWNEQQKMLAETIAGFPKEFGLRAWPGNVFSISRTKSYVNSADEVMLVSQVKRGPEWFDFAKGTPAELLAEIVPLSK